MDEVSLAVVATLVLVYSVISGRLERSWITAPMVFVVFGWLLGDDALGLLEAGTQEAFIDLVAHVTLALVIFSDATRINLRLLIRQEDLPVRLLLLGLPLTVIGATLAALMIFSEMSIWQGTVLAVVLAPTDAALAQTVVNSERVPDRVRQALNVESGLNDGLALPFLLLFISLAAIGGETQGPGYWVSFAGRQLLFGVLIGGLAGYVGGKLIGWGTRSGASFATFQRLAILALALMAYASAESAGGNGFVAVFVAGLAFGNAEPEACEPLHIFIESEGALLVLLTFLLYGTVMLPQALPALDGRVLVYAILSLTLLRMIPVVLALIGTGLLTSSRLFLGWFGPRGIASIVYVQVLLGEASIPGQELIYVTAVTTVLLSVFLHGISAHPLVKLYAWLLDRREEAEMESEMREVTMMPTRGHKQVPRHQGQPYQETG